MDIARRKMRDTFSPILVQILKGNNRMVSKTLVIVTCMHIKIHFFLKKKLLNACGLSVPSRRGGMKQLHQTAKSFVSPFAVK